jgi:hypothetical protein
MDNYPSNSHSSRETELAGDKSKDVEGKKLDPIVTSGVLRRKKPLSTRFKETFFGGDAQGVVGYVVFEVIVPAAKDMAADAISQGIEKILYGEARSHGRRTGARPGGSNGYVSYNRYSSSGLANANRGADPRAEIPRRSRGARDFDDIIIPTRAAAEAVIDQMFAIISQYGEASVADLLELVDQRFEYTDRKWGWKDFQGAGATRITNGYLLDLPKTIAL